jgi:hypothetical protein
MWCVNLLSMILTLKIWRSIVINVVIDLYRLFLCRRRRRRCRCCRLRCSPLCLLLFDGGDGKCPKILRNTQEKEKLNSTRWPCKKMHFEEVDFFSSLQKKKFWRKVNISAKNKKESHFLRDEVMLIKILWTSGSQTRGRDPFEGRQTYKKGRQIFKIWFFWSCGPKLSHFRRYFTSKRVARCLKGGQIFINNCRGRQPKKVWEPLLWTIFDEIYKNK